MLVIIQNPLNYCTEYKTYFFRVRAYTHLWEYFVFERLGRCHFGNHKTVREYQGRTTASAVALFRHGRVGSESEEIEGWEKVISCLGWWNHSFSKNTNMHDFRGYAWYRKSFELPEEEYVVSLGGFDETDVIRVNGERVGCTGMNPDAWTHVEDKWDTIRIYSVPASFLHFGGENEFYQSGDGGWYGGHPCLYTKAAYGAAFGGEQEGSSLLQVTIPLA